MACWGRQAALEPPWRCFPGRLGSPPASRRRPCQLRRLHPQAPAVRWI